MSIDIAWKTRRCLIWWHQIYIQHSNCWLGIRIGIHSTGFTGQIVSEPCRKSESEGVYLLYMLNNVWMGLNIFVKGKTPNRMLFHLTDTPDHVRTIHNEFYWSKSELDGIHPIYILNNVRMDPNIIFVDGTPSRMLFYPIDTPDNVRTIHNKF